MTEGSRPGEPETDVLVVGSGAGGVHAAAALVERGRSVTLLDYGNVDSTYAALIPRRPWSELRAADPDQHRYFLGDRFEGIGFGPVRVGAQLTPPRAFIARDTERLLPVDSDTFSVTESLARGGLAAGWGAGVFPFDDRDLAAFPYTRGELDPHYGAVAERIGVAGADDDLAPLLGDHDGLLPPLEIDSGAEQVLERYTAKRESFRRRGLNLGVTRLAACSVEHRGRGPHRYLDMDFWSDEGRSVYRAQWTLAELETRAGFRYLDRRFVLRFDERAEGPVEVRCRHADSGEVEVHRARALVLAAGTLGSARIVLRSLGRYGQPLPLLCNPYTYVPLVNTGMLGRTPRDRRHSLAQLTAIYEPPHGAPQVLAQYYSYRSLLTYKLMKESPLAYRETRRLACLLEPVLGILGIHHEDRPSASKTCTLRRHAGDAPDRLEVDYRPAPGEERANGAAERALIREFRRLGCWALRRVRPGHGSNIHYAGCLPYAREERELTCDPEGRLRGTRAVYLADGSAFPTIPAKGLTFTIMANADRVGARLADRLASGARA